MAEATWDGRGQKVRLTDQWFVLLQQVDGLVVESTQCAIDESLRPIASRGSRAPFRD